MTPETARQALITHLALSMWRHWYEARQIPNLAENTREANAHILEIATAYGIAAEVAAEYASLIA